MSALVKRTNGLLFPRLMDEFFNDDFFSFGKEFSGSNLVPQADIIENEKEWKIDLMLAGVDKKDIKLNIENGILSVEAERKEEKEGKYNRKEMVYGKMKRSFTVSENIDIDNVDAKYNNGILSLVLPKVKEEKVVKTIEIK